MPIQFESKLTHLEKSQLEKLSEFDLIAEDYALIILHFRHQLFSINCFTLEWVVYQDFPFNKEVINKLNKIMNILKERVKFTIVGGTTYVENY
jgi:hypothetical protein